VVARAALSELDRTREALMAEFRSQIAAGRSTARLALEEVWAAGRGRGARPLHRAGRPRPREGERRHRRDRVERRLVDGARRHVGRDRRRQADRRVRAPRADGEEIAATPFILSRVGEAELTRQRAYLDANESEVARERAELVSETGSQTFL
jgi:hypothetical protein